MSSNMDLPVIATLDMVGYAEYRRVDSVKDPGSDHVKYLAPVSGTQQAFIDVRTSKGQVYRIPVSQDVLTAICDSFVAA